LWDCLEIELIYIFTLIFACFCCILGGFLHARLGEFNEISIFLRLVFLVLLPIGLLVMFLDNWWAFLLGGALYKLGELLYRLKTDKDFF